MSQNPSLKDLMLEHWELAFTLRKLKIHFDASKCIGDWQCYEVCPVGCWEPDFEKRVSHHVYPDQCVACKACVLQCPEGAIELKVPG